MKRKQSATGASSSRTSPPTSKRPPPASEGLSANSPIPEMPHTPQPTITPIPPAPSTTAPESTHVTPTMPTIPNVRYKVKAHKSTIPPAHRPKPSPSMPAKEVPPATAPPSAQNPNLSPSTAATEWLLLLSQNGRFIPNKGLLLECSDGLVGAIVNQHHLGSLLANSGSYNINMVQEFHANLLDKDREGRVFVGGQRIDISPVAINSFYAAR